MRRAGPLAARAALCGLLGLTACASLQKRCAEKPWMLCGDRVTVHRDFVYLDDPAYLYNNQAVAFHGPDAYGFRLSLFFNPYRYPASRVTAELRHREDTVTYVSPCRIGPAGSGGAAPPFDSLPPAYSASASARKDRVALAFLCRDYQPRWGRIDTLELRLAAPSRADSATGSPADSAAVLRLPFSTSFHGPVYSFAAGALLILSMTAWGEFLAAGK